MLLPEPVTLSKAPPILSMMAVLTEELENACRVERSSPDRSSPAVHFRLLGNGATVDENNVEMNGLGIY